MESVTRYIGKAQIKDIFKLFLGTILQTAPYAFIMVPLRIVNGGVTSFSLVLHGLTGLDIIILTNVMIGLLMLLAWLGMGKECLVKSVLGSLFYTWTFALFLSMELVLPWPMPLAVLIAALSVGTGYYLCIHARGSSMGFDVIALILNKKNPKIRINVAMRLINISVILIGFAVFGMTSILAGIAFTLIQTWILGAWIAWKPMQKQSLS